MSENNKTNTISSAGVDFSLDEIDLASVDQAVRQTAGDGRAAKPGKDSMAFPELQAKSSAEPRASQPRHLPPGPIASAGGGADSLLGALRQQALSHQEREANSGNSRELLSRRVDRALRQAFSYLNELVELLNQLKPEIPKDYILATDDVFSGMSWQEGFCDYRSEETHGGTLMKGLSFSYQLAAPKQLRVVRDDSQIDKFRALLFENKLSFDCEEFRNERRYVEKAEFNIPVEIKINTDWQADFSKGVIIINASNLGRFGLSEYILKPESIDEPLLEQFSNMVLGRPNRFPSLVRAQAPQIGLMPPKRP